MIETVWNCAKENKGDNIHQACANAVEMIMKTAIAKRTVDNITVVMISFSSFKYLLFPKRPDLIGNNSLDNINDYRNLHEIHRINNSFDYSSNAGSAEFSLQLNLLNQQGIQEKLKENDSKTPINQPPSNIAHNQNKSNNVIRKKTGNTSINNNLNQVKKKNEVSQEKKPANSMNKTNFMGLHNYNSNVMGMTNNVSNNNGGQRVSAKKSENNLYSYRGIGKNPEKRK